VTVEKFHLVAVAAVSFIVLATGVGFSQRKAADVVGSARISGKVVDATGTAIPNAAVTLKTAVGASIGVRTESGGEFEFASVMAQSNELMIEVPDFVTYRRAVEVAPAQQFEIGTIAMQAASTICPTDVSVPVAYITAPSPTSLRSGGMAQDSKVQDAAISASLCELSSYPDQYNGRVISVRASVAGNPMSIDDFTEKCSSWMWVIVSLPDTLKPLPDIRLVRDRSLQELFDSLHGGMNVQATFEGRFEAAFTWHDKMRVAVAGSPYRGFGKKYQYGGRLILHRVSDVLARPVPRK
jgi:hypothetical protein